jgi:DNA-binding NtrC family response regulator
MFHAKLLKKQLALSGVRLGDVCHVWPSQGKRRTVRFNWHRIDVVSSNLRDPHTAISTIELPHSGVDEFHYRFELEDERYVLKTLKGKPYCLNGQVAREAFVERSDRVFIEDHRLNFIGESFAKSFDHPVLSQEQLLQSELKILILGETGTGKTHLARRIHEKSARLGEFVGLNLTSFNPQLIESELFGHRKGAFTGATLDKVGAIGLAHRGTLFLDEIDSLPIDLQTKLLTFVDSKAYRPVGESRELSADVRLIFAAGKSLERLVENNLFRRDFYYRLRSGHSVQLNPLRSDPGKVLEACAHFGSQHGLVFSQRVIEFYQSLAWPGNLRQLFGHLEKKRILSKGTRIDFDHLDEEFLLQSSDLMALAENGEIAPMERCKYEHAQRALIACHGNVALAARALGLSEKTVKRILLSSQECT